jgi:hypothetical protein
VLAKQEGEGEAGEDMFAVAAVQQARLTLLLNQATD